MKYVKRVIDMKPVIAVNFKAYKNAVGKNSVKLAKICEKFSQKAKIIVCINPVDLKDVVRKVKVDVYCQHMDSNDYGKFTGSILGEAVKSAGAKGVLLNHSEKRISFDTLKKTVAKAKKLGLKTIVCAKDSEEAKKISALKPDFVAVEPPELIGGKISVSTARPELIKKTVTLVSKRCLVLVGAGVHEKSDIDIALKFKAKGVLLASVITQAKNPKKALKELLM